MYLTEMGSVDYKKALELQHRIVKLKEDSFSDILLLVEHPSVITVGHRGKEENILVSKDFLKDKEFSLLHVERGGDVTCHEPGQLVGYPLIRLKNFNLKVKDFIEKIEEVIIETLKTYSVTGRRNKLNNGVWIGKKKIASIGIRLKKWISFHGFSLNVNNDLYGFSLIRPCGLKDVGVTSIKEVTGKEIPVEEVSKELIKNFSHIFNIKFQVLSPEELFERIEFFEDKKT